MEVVANFISGGWSLSLAHALIFKGVLLVLLARGAFFCFDICCLSSGHAAGVDAVIHPLQGQGSYLPFVENSQKLEGGVSIWDDRETEGKCFRLMGKYYRFVCLEFFSYKIRDGEFSCLLFEQIWQILLLFAVVHVRNAAGLVEYNCTMASVNSLNVESRRGSSDGVCEGEVWLPPEISLVIKVSCFS